MLLKVYEQDCENQQLQMLSPKNKMIISKGKLLKRQRGRMHQNIAGKTMELQKRDKLLHQSGRRQDGEGQCNDDFDVLDDKNHAKGQNIDSKSTIKKIGRAIAYKSNTLRLHQPPGKDGNEYDNYQFINQSSKASLKNLEI